MPEEKDFPVGGLELLEGGLMWKGSMYSMGSSGGKKGIG
jgi:hypothetical protein